ncbi:hypothetical protein PSECIP111951_00098 [Pseudoalteromonas holothuriae]|uniref:Orphan protein n=1 Tax=Pseudoalteromonas holothuriae TaxID=2963714 RepID=A0A9W4VSN5_9GAMM|nr:MULTISPECIES: hypothetical protein [unclassified Pseudoalteromonas]CAH9050002.1 hypothetical protein PSECIP111951_00098 [Pseudoalteromonas sp. CIP111951]CAH9052687.1 hypothetical protein PSECIP111854_01021 [Pseudoalteromonas sp. CIP111854]
MQNTTLILKAANTALVLLALSFSASVIASYPLADYFSLPWQISLHISTIVIAGLFKLSYVARCVCQYQLGMEVK